VFIIPKQVTNIYQAKTNIHQAKPITVKLSQKWKITQSLIMTRSQKQR